MTRYYFTAHVADLEDESLDAAFSRLRGEIVVDGVVVSAVAPPRLALRPRITDTPKIASHEAAAWFQPTAKHYANTRLRPNTASAIKSRNALAKLIAAATQQSLAVRAAVDLFDNAALVSRHGTIACVDLFGRPHESRVCPSHPDVREFAASVVEDLASNFEIEAIELGDVHFGRGLYTESHIESGAVLSDAVTSLLGWCFCPACRQRADELNLDADGVIAELNELLAPHLELHSSIRERAFNDLISSSEQLSAYSRMRADAVTSLIRGIRRRCEKPLLVRLPVDGLMAGLQPADVSDFVDGFVVPGGPIPTGNSASNITQNRLALSMQCHPPAIVDGPSLVAAVHEAARSGVASITFSDYGLTPEPCLDWVRQAIRFARRESV